MSDMTEQNAPERIWATGDACNGSWTYAQVPEKWGAAVTEYVRSDLHQAAICRAELAEEEHQYSLGLLNSAYDAAWTAAIEAAANVSGHYMTDEADEVLLNMWRTDIRALRRETEGG